MRERNNRIQFRLSDKEYQYFKKEVGKTHLTQEAYLRQLVNGLVPRKDVPHDYFKMMNTFYATTAAAKELAQIARQFKVIDEKEYDDVIELFVTAIRAMGEEFLLPEPIGIETLLVRGLLNEENKADN